MAIEFKELPDVGLADDSSDRVIWEYCQANKCILITADRSANDAEESFEYIIRQSGNDTSLPFVTIADPNHVAKDRDYATRCAFKLLDYLDRMDELAGTGRIYLSA